MGALLASPLFLGTAQASLIQIDDLTDVVGLYVDNNLITGDGGQISNYSNIVDTDGSEILSFTFESALPWNYDFHKYVLMNGRSEDASGPSDLFLIDGLAGSYSDHIQFISSDVMDRLDPAFYGTLYPYTPWTTSPLIENDTYQTLIDTGADIYQARSDAPEPATLALLGLGFMGLAFGNRRWAALATVKI